MVKVQNNPLASQYEQYVDGDLIFVLRYHMEHGQMWMLSVKTSALEVTPQRVDEFLLQVFQDVHRRRIEVLPFSPRIRAFMVKNTVLLRLVPNKTPGHFPNLPTAAALLQQRKTTVKIGAYKKAKAPKQPLVVHQKTTVQPVKRRNIERKRALRFTTVPRPQPIAGRPKVDSVS